jgi:hypothetical protein
MGHDRTQQGTPDLFSAPSFGGPSPPATKPVTSVPERRHILPKALPNAVKHLTDRELDLLIAASLDEAKRRGRSPTGVQVDEPRPKRSPPPDKSSPRRQVEAATVSLTRGQVNAVRAAAKAGVKPSMIARQFRISQSDVRKVLASDARGGFPRGGWQRSFDRTIIVSKKNTNAIANTAKGSESVCVQL